MSRFSVNNVNVNEIENINENGLLIIYCNAITKTRSTTLKDINNESYTEPGGPPALPEKRQQQ